MKINVNKRDQTLVFEINGELDIATVDLFKDKLLGIEPGLREVLIDFYGVRFVDSTGIGGLIEVLRVYQETNIIVQVVNIHEKVYEIFDLLGIPELFEEVKFIAEQKHDELRV